MKIFIEKCSGCILCGYNFFYDWAWLYNTLNNLGAFNPPFYYHKLDVLSMAYLILKDESAIENFSLTDVCQYLDIKRDKCHNAFYDAKFTFEVYKKLWEKIENKSNPIVNQ
jgi:DNA polymerase III alpha subunit (gram-positive type)